MLTVNFVVVLNKIQVVLLSTHPSQRFHSISQARIISLTKTLYDLYITFRILEATNKAVGKFRVVAV